MALNPFNVLKRKLGDHNAPMSKRLRLAKNVIHTQHFSTAPKERVVFEWLECVSKEGKLTHEDLRNVLSWISTVNEVTTELQSRLIQFTSHYIKSQELETNDVSHIMQFIENSKISSQLSLHIEEYCLITKRLLKLHTIDSKQNVNKILNNLTSYYKESKKKLELIDKIIHDEYIEIIFNYLDNGDCKDAVINVCQTLFFPMSKKSFFALFLRSALLKQNIDELMKEQGENMQSVMKLMNMFFTFPNGRSSNDCNFLKKFIVAFVTSFKTESQLIFLFYAIIAGPIGLQQTYISPSMKMDSINFEGNSEKMKRSIFLVMLGVLIENEIDVSVRLTDTSLDGKKIHIKKNFTVFLQSILMNILKLEGKPDRLSLQIIASVLKLDPILVESNIEKLIAPIMCAKKNAQCLDTYVNMLNYLIEMLFKLGKGLTFVTQILPHIKLILESGNTEQSELLAKEKEFIESSLDIEKIKFKILNGLDIFPKECIETYGKLSSELMYRQNSEMLLSLQKDFEEHCLIVLEQDKVNPSLITITEVLSAILSTFFEHNKMADHTVPQQIAEDFWMMFYNFENELLKRFGKCILKIDYNPRLAQSFLQLCQSYAKLKLLNVMYSQVKLQNLQVDNATDVFDLNFLLPCLSSKQWTKLGSMINDFETAFVLDNLLLMKSTAADLLSALDPDKKYNVISHSTKSHLIKEISGNINMINNGETAKMLFANLDSRQSRQLAKTLVEDLLDKPNGCILNNSAVLNNIPLLSALILQTLRNLTKSIENTTNVTMSISKAMNKTDYDITAFMSEVNNVPEYFEALSVKREYPDYENINNSIHILNRLSIAYLDDNCKLSTIFVLLILKKSSDSKKLRKSIDQLLQSIFELSPKCPDLYKIFSVEYIFNFDDVAVLELLTLKNETSNPQLIIKCLLEAAVKKVKSNSEVVKTLVKILLKNQKLKKDDPSNMAYFSDRVFQISCAILPIITKEKKIITASTLRAILADLQEKLYKALLKSFKSINFHNEKSQFLEKAGNPEDNSTLLENKLATLNAMEAFSLTLSKYCDTNQAEEVKNLDFLWNGLGYFVDNAISSIHAQESKPHHIESSIQLLNVVLKNIKKLESHEIFQKKDKLFIQIWQSVKTRLHIMFEGKFKNQLVKNSFLEDVGVTLKFLCELSSIECFAGHLANDSFNFMTLKKPPTNEEKSIITSHKVANYLWTSILKANLLDRKCAAVSKYIYRACKNLCHWIRQHFENVPETKSKNDDIETAEVEVNDVVCEILKNYLDVLTQVGFAAKKIPLHFKFLDAIFESQHMIQFIMGRKTMEIECKVSWQSYFQLYEGSIAVLNSLLLSREELLEDRWPCFLQCYRGLASSLCEKSSSQAELGKCNEEKLAAISHSVEKLTQSISKRKTHVARLSAYLLADICAWIEKYGPIRPVRQHLENSVALLIEASDSNHAMVFLRRGLAGSTGQMTMTNMYSMYKRYYKYVGNA